MKMKYVDRSEYWTLKDKGKKIENWQRIDIGEELEDNLESE